MRRDPIHPSLPLEYAIFVGVFLSIVILLRLTGTTDLTQLVPRHDGGFDEVPFQRAAPSPVVMVNMEGDQVIGAVYLTDLFQAAAALAITHESEGIDLKPEQK